MRVTSEASCRDSDKARRVTIEHAPLGFELKIRGRRFVAGLNGDTDDEYQLPALAEYQGVAVEVANAIDGDYAELYVVVPGDPPVVAAQLGYTVYIKPSGTIRIIADGTVTLSAGLILRTRYHSVATTGPAPVVYADHWIWEQ